jgi:membrane protease YdiL (CAAX protease family)
VVAWSVRLLDQESFCYPGLVRAGWGRFRRWGAAPVAAGGLEAIAVYAICAAGFLYGGAHLAKFGPVTQVIGPLLCFIGLPPLIHAWLAGHRAEALHLTKPATSDVLRSVVIAPLALLLSLAISSLQPTPPPDQASSEQMGLIFALIHAQGGLPLVILCIAVAPGICEELLCRGTLLSGLRRGLGPAGAVLISSFLFAVLHLSPYRFLPQFAVGVVLALLALRSGSILPGMMVHTLHNAGAVLFALWLGDALDTDALLSTPQAILIACASLVALAALLRTKWA